MKYEILFLFLHRQLKILNYLNQFNNDTFKHTATHSNTQLRLRFKHLVLSFVFFFSVSSAFSQLCNTLGWTADLTVGVGTPYPNASSLPNTNLLGTYIHVVGDFTVDKDLYITAGWLRINNGKKISVVLTNYYEGHILSLSNTFIAAYNCGDLWQGIDVGSFCNVSTSYGTWIEDAETAISSINTSFASVNISNTLFQRNKVGISLDHNNPNGWFVVPPMLSYFVNNTFIGRGGSPILNQDVGVKIKNCPYSLAWNYGNTNNYFNGLKKGITLEGSNSIFYINGQ